MLAPKSRVKAKPNAKAEPVAAPETRAALERGEHRSVIKAIQARFPKILARLGE